VVRLWHFVPSSPGAGPQLRYSGCVELEALQALALRHHRGCVTRGGVSFLRPVVSRLLRMASLPVLLVGTGACSDGHSLGVERRRPDDISTSPWVAPTTDVTQTSGTTSSPVPQPSTSPSTTIDEIGDGFEEEECPDIYVPPPSTECEPLGDAGECGEGFACYPYVRYPSSRCETESFGTRCDFAGTGTQGHPCSGERCANGFLCVVTSRGTECAQLCRVPGPNTCPTGLICGSLDIDGFGVCT
jgi:hypothetical protein